jgi:hypothetical protein
MNYETDKFVLLETVLMLSFFGPQMNSIYNVCSWLGFAFTIAESMSIHRSDSALDASNPDRGRMKRLWWTLVVRDAYCAALLGRPFRINIPQCDVPMLELEDFDDDAEPNDNESRDSALYQIQVARLSIITRTIVQRRFHSSESDADTNDLEHNLATWLSQVPKELSWTEQSSTANVHATALKLLYQQHRILLHHDPRNSLNTPTISQFANNAAARTAIDAAQAIASSASTLVTRRMINRLPHEVFTGFFMAGIVYYRQLHDPDPLLAQIARASLDNCQLLLHEVCGSWDPAHWSINIFDFLLSFIDSKDEEASADHPLDEIPVAAVEHDGNMVSDGYNLSLDEYGLQGDDWMGTSGWSPPNISVPGAFNDFLLMPNFFTRGG